MVFPFQTDMAKPRPSKPRKRKTPAPPASVASDDDTGTAAEETQQVDGADTEEGRVDAADDGGAAADAGGDAAEDIRLARSCVHDEFVQTSLTEEVISKTGKKRKVTSWSSECKHCKKVFPHKKQYALKRHLQSKHIDRAKIAEHKDDLNRDAQRADRDKPVVNRKMYALDLYTDWILDSGHPLNTSDNEKFKKFVAFLDPEVTIPGRNAITNLLDKKYQSMMTRLKARLEEARRCHLTMDGWSNRRCRSSFLGATVHFFNQKKRKRENYRLCLRKFNSRHTAPNIMAMTQSILQEFGIGHKCHVINTDNGSNIRRAMMDLSLVEVETEAVDINMNTEQEGVANQVVDEFLPEDLADEPLGLPVLDAGVGGTDLEDEDQERDHFIKQLEDEVENFAIAKRLYGLTPLRCMAHLLQLPILKILHKDHQDNVFKELLSKVRKMVGKYSKSVNAKGELYRMVHLLVVTYVVTRWWSDVDMMARLKRINKVNNKAINKVITKCEWDEELVLTKDDFDLMEKFLALFKPIKKMSDQLNGESYSTINLVFPTVKDIKSHIDSFKKDRLIGAAAKSLSKEFDNYFR